MKTPKKTPGGGAGRTGIHGEARQGDERREPSPRPSPSAEGEGVDAAVRAYMAANGRKGGVVTSEAKARAVRENGKKGGRPRKQPLKALEAQIIKQIKKDPAMKNIPIIVEGKALKKGGK